MAEIDRPDGDDESLDPGAEVPTPPARKRRRRRATTAVDVGAAIDAMDAPGSPAETSDTVQPAEAEAAERAAEREAAEIASLAVEPSPVDGAAVAPRRGLAARFLILVVSVLVVLAIGVGLGFGAANLVPSIADASPPAATLAPPTERPTEPPIPTPQPTVTPSPTPSPEPSPTPLVHTVKRGENLTRIAERYKVTVAAIVEANQLKDANLIEVGQKLVIPQP